MVKSAQPRKQRKALFQAPLHRRHKLMHAHLADDLSGKYDHRSLRVAKGDTVRMMRGSHVGHEGKVQSVNLKKGHLTVEGVSVTKADGSEVPYPVHPSNIMITKLNLKDDSREAKIKS